MENYNIQASVNLNLKYLAVPKLSGTFVYLLWFKTKSISLRKTWKRMIFIFSVTPKHEALLQPTLSFPKYFRNINHRYISLTKTEPFNSNLSKHIQFEEEILLLFPVFRKICKKIRV